MAHAVTLGQFIEDGKIQTVAHNRTSHNMYVTTRWISRVAALDKDLLYMFSVIDNGEVTYCTRAELPKVLGLAEHDVVLAYYLPGMEPEAPPKRYGVFKVDPKNSDWSYWYTDTQYSFAEATSLTNHYNNYRSEAERSQGVHYETRQFSDNE